MSTWNYYYQQPPLSAGGEKTVHAGYCIETGTPVVLKFLNNPYTWQDLERFKQEISRLQQVQGPGVAQLVAFNLEWTPPFYVEEFFPEGTLANFMARQFQTGRAFDEITALLYVEQLLHTLATNLHARNQIHRDLKPANLMVRNGQLIFIDMGLGRTLDRNTTLQTRMFKGTRGYAAPEQEMATNGFGVDHRCDVYSVGVILHELLTGLRGAYNYQIYTRDPAIQGLLSRMLSMRRESRPSAAEALAAATALRSRYPRR